MDESRWLPGGLRFEIHLDRERTAGKLCMLVDHPPAGWSLPPHRHRTEAETIHVVEGAFEMLIDGRPVLLGPGDTAHVPLGVVHSGGNVGTETGKRIVVFSPAGIEDWFREVGTAEADGAFDQEAALASATRHGWEFVR